MKIDTSKFKKVDCDDNCTTLAHPSGHEIKIAHKGLSPELKKVLDEIPVHLAKGGRAKFARQYDPTVNPKGARPSQVSKSSNNMPGSPTMAKDNFTEPNAMGTSIPKGMLQQELHDKHQPDVVLNALGKKAPPFGPLGADEKQHYPPCINPSCKSFGTSHPNCRCYGGGPNKEGGFAQGGKIESYCSTKKPHEQGCEYFKEGGMAGDETAEHHYLPELTATPGAAEELSGPTPNPAPTPAPVQDPLTQFNMTAPENLQQPDINPNPEVHSAASEPAPMPEEKPTDRAPAAAQPETKMQQFDQHKENAKQELFPEAQAFQADLDNGHIKPETYQSLFHDKGTLGKVGTIFGLLLSGGGSAVSGQPNALLHMMDKQIENDLNAQQNSVSNKQNFLKINQQNIMNKAQANSLNVEAKTKAYALSRVQMNYAALHKLVSDTQKLPDGPQKQQAMQTLAMMNQGVQNENFNILDRAASGAAFYKTLFGQGEGSGEPGFQQKIGGMKMLGPQGEKRAEDMEQKHFPGIQGQASAPLSGEDKEQIGSGVEFDRQLHNYMNWAKGHSGDLNPKDIAYGKSLAAGVQGAYRQATHGGVYKEGEQNFISKIIDDDPTKFFNELRVMPKVQAVADAHQIRMDQLLKNKGFKGYKSQQTGSSDSDTKMMHRAQYKKVDGGWQKVK